MDVGRKEKEEVDRMQMDLRELRWLRLTEKKEPQHWEGEESTLL